MMWSILDLFVKLFEKSNNRDPYEYFQKKWSREWSVRDDVVLSAESVGSFEWSDVVTKKTEDESRSDNVIWDIFMSTKWIRNPTRLGRSSEAGIWVCPLCYDCDWKYSFYCFWEFKGWWLTMLCYAVPSAEYIRCNYCNLNVSLRLRLLLFPS